MTTIRNISCIVFLSFPISSYSNEIEKRIYSSKPDKEKTSAIFPETRIWPNEIKCIRIKTKAYGEKSSESLNHRDFYIINFRKNIWSNFNHDGYLKYLGDGYGEFGVTYALHDDDGYLFKILSIRKSGKNLMATRSEVVGNNVFAYWSECKVVK